MPTVPSSRSAPDAPAAGRRQLRIPPPILAAVLAITCLYLAPLASPRKTSPSPDDYYGFLTEAFCLGQLHLNVPVDPKLLTLENPYAGVQGTQRPHDMSFYRGRFYLYYGATPVFLIYLPWRLLTGSYLDEAVGTTLMLWGGFLLAAAWLTSVWRRWFAALSAWWPALLIVTIGLSPPLITEIHNDTFYAVPIAGAVFCVMLAFTATTRAMQAATAARQAAWLAAASLCWGLAVGSRPTYVLGLVMLVAPAGWLWWHANRGIRWQWAGLRLLAATLVPAAVIGLAIMFYNYMRFDSPVDFGIRFSMASGDIREAHLVGPEFIPKNLHLYLIRVGAFMRYAPFLITGGDPYGLLPHLPFAALALLAPVTWFLARPARGQWVLGTGVLLGAAAANFSLLCLFFGHHERYLLDFVPLLLPLAGATALALVLATRQFPNRFLRMTAVTLVMVSMAYTSFTGLMQALSRQPDSPAKIKLERLLNMPAYLMEQSRGVVHGPVELMVSFPRGRSGTREPLVTTGYGRDLGDVIAVHYLDESHVQFSAFHVGRGGPVSEPVEIDYHVPHRLRIGLGSLYPPPGHPLFAGWPTPQVNRIRRRLKIDLDGQPVLQGNFTVYPSTPASVRLGRSTLADDIAGPAFTGKILEQRRLGLDPSEAAGFESIAGPVRLTVRFPPRSGDEGLPLVVTGTDQRGDLLFAELLEGNRVQFGHDSFGAGAARSPAVPYEPGRDHVIEVEMGSLYPTSTQTSPALRQRLRVAFNGSTLLDIPRPFNPSSPDDVDFGFNTIRASTAISYFPGAIRKIERFAPRPPEQPAAGWGFLRLAVAFPPLTAGVEPLVVTGDAGRADLLFVRYEPDGAIRFGLDHWGIGAATSEPLHLDRNQTHLVEVLSGALLPPPDDPRWAGRDPAEVERLRNRFEVRLNGKTVFTPPFAPYPNLPETLAIGTNLIGASTAELSFTGRFLLVERTPW